MARRNTKREVDEWLDRHGYTRRHARRVKEEHPYAVSTRMAHARIAEGEQKFKVGDIVRRTAAAMRSMGVVSGPINGRVEGYSGRWPLIRWSNMSDTEEPMAQAEAGLELDKRAMAKRGHARIIHQEPTGRPVFAEHERDHHITTSGRRALAASQFALPPGPEEKRRGIKGRLPIDEIGRARSALARASMMHHEGTITARQLQQVRRAVHAKWPSIDIESHARMIESPASGRDIFAAKERDHHITTHGRQTLAASQFALPPGAEEKRRGIKGRLPIDTLARARNALARAAQMKKAGHISAGQLATVRRKVHAAWPSIES